jgi:hypothetical protein
MSPDDLFNLVTADKKLGQAGTELTAEDFRAALDSLQRQMFGPPPRTVFVVPSIVPRMPIAMGALDRIRRYETYWPFPFDDIAWPDGRVEPFRLPHSDEWNALTPEEQNARITESAERAQPVLLECIALEGWKHR